MSGQPRVNRSVLEIPTATLLILALSAAGCASSYVPKRQGRRVSVVMQDGELGYSRDGHFYSHGFFGGGLVQAVQGVPRAEAAARTHRRRGIWGTILTASGLACTLLAPTLLRDEEPRYYSRPASATMLGCGVVMLLGTGVLLSGIPYRYDAVNLFNDGLVPTGPVGDFPPSMVPVR